MNHKPASFGVLFRKKIINKIKKSRAATVVLTVLAWFAVSAGVGTMMWRFDGEKHAWSVYFYNAFTIFSNLNDDLGLSIAKQDGAGLLQINLPMMAASMILIICGMIGIALLTAQITKGSLNMEEERFDRLIDELRDLAIKATAQSGEKRMDPHRVLSIITARIHGEIVPIRTNESVHPINIYEFEYILVNVVNRVIEECGILGAPAQAFTVYNEVKIRETVRWAENLDIVYKHLNDSQRSPINDDLRRAWRNFSVNLPDRIAEAEGAQKRMAS